MVGQLQDVSVVGRVPFSWQAVLMRHCLNPVDHLRRRDAAAAAAAAEGDTITHVYMK